MSNCLFYALAQFWKRGGHVVMRRSHHGWWPHFAWSLDLITFEEFHPNKKAHARLIPPPLFYGHIHEHTPSKCPETTSGE